MAKYSNFVALRGQLAADPRPRQAGQHQLVELRLGVHTAKRAAPGQAPDWENNYFNVTCWREQATEAATLKKGDQIGVIGRLKYREWQDKETGKTRSAVDIVADALTTAIIPALPGGQPSFEQMSPQPVASGGDDSWGF